MVLGNIIGGFVVILVGTNLFPTLADNTKAAQDSANITGASVTIIGLTNIFFALGIMAAGVQMAVIGLQEAGLV